MRVLVTRPERDAKITAARLAALGHVAIIAPVTQIEPSNAAIASGPFSAVIATSSHAMEVLDSATAFRLRTIPVFCVGARTAEQARARGFQTVHPAAPDVKALVASWAPESSAGKILYLAGRHRKPLFEDELGARGLSFEIAVVYTAVAAPKLPDTAIDALRAGVIDAALGFSRRGAEILIELTRDAGLLDHLIAVPQICISADAARPLASLGARVLVATEPTAAGLFAALDSV